MPPTRQKDAQATARRPAEDDDICPVCKSSRYLNPNMRFLVNPECYHKMCESCVDRIFSHGPAPCPIAGCRRTLRKAKFRKQTFEDIQVEREVDIRRRVASVFNRCEEDFDTLLDYNNYLNDVEDITFNLVNKIDVAETERKLVAYAEANKQAISNNMARESQTKLSRESIKAHENDLTRLRREAAQIEDEQRLREREESRRDLIEKLATGDASAVEAVKAAQTVKLKKTSARKAMQGAQNNLEGKKADMASRSGAADSAFEIKGLKKRVEPQPEKAYDPFADLSFQPKYFVLQDRYAWHWLDDARKEPKYAAGGYNVQDYCARALCDAFSGLGVFVEDRDASKETSGASFGVAAKSTDENITTKSNADDVFV